MATKLPARATETAVSQPTETVTPTKPKLETDGAADAEATALAETREKKIASWTRRIRNARITQSVLGSLLSIAVAAFQGHVYVDFTSSSKAPGAWPENPNLMPTLLLLAVGICALVVDLCLLAAYARPAARMARVAFGVAKAVHYMVTSAKTVGYAISALVMQTSYNYGTGTGLTNDLWSWTCSNAAEATANISHGPTNCNIQWAAFGFAIAQLGIEAIGWIIDIMTFLQSRHERPEDTAEGRVGLMEGYQGDMDAKAAAATPKYELDFKNLGA